jgi:LPS sulfotransferase NodH
LLIAPWRSYLVCASQRSGSTLLCELLKETAVAGHPEEYFEATRETGAPPHPGEYLKDLPRTGAGIRDDPSLPEAPPHSSLQGLSSYCEHLDRTFRLGTTDNGVFGAKLMWSQLSELHSLAGELPEYQGLGRFDLLQRLFDCPRYIRVIRRDKVRQAVSLWRALQTRRWRLEHAPGDSHPVELRYRFQGIDHLVQSFEDEDRSWKEFFAAHRVSPLSIVYEDDLELDLDRTVRKALDHIGAAAPAGWEADEPIKRQADATSEEWVAAYHREVAQRRAKPSAAGVAAI